MLAGHVAGISLAVTVVLRLWGGVRPEQSAHTESFGRVRTIRSVVADGSMQSLHTVAYFLSASSKGMGDATRFQAGMAWPIITIIPFT